MDHLDSFKRKGEILLDKDMEIPDEGHYGNAFETDDVVVLKLQIALNQLSIDEKGLLCMKYIDEISIRDIADLLKTSESAIKMRLLRSKEKLRVNYRLQLN